MPVDDSIFDDHDDEAIRYSSHPQAVEARRLLSCLTDALKTTNVPAQVAACEEICTWICVGGEEGVRNIDVAEYVKTLARIVTDHKQYALGLQVIAMRGLALMVDTVPKTCPIIVNLDLVPTLLRLCQKESLVCYTPFSEELFKCIEVLSLEAHHAMLGHEAIPIILDCRTKICMQAASPSVEVSSSAVTTNINTAYRLLGVLMCIFSAARPTDWRDLEAAFPHICSLMMKQTAYISEGEAPLGTKDLYETTSRLCRCLAYLVDRVSYNDATLERLLGDTSLLVIPSLMGLLSVLPGKVSFTIQQTATLQKEIIGTLASIYLTSPAVALKYFTEFDVVAGVCEVIASTLNNTDDKGRGDGPGGIAGRRRGGGSGVSDSPQNHRANNSSTLPTGTTEVDALDLVADEKLSQLFLDFLLLLVPAFSGLDDPVCQALAEVVIPHHTWKWEDDFHNRVDYDENLCRRMEEEYQRQRRTQQYDVFSLNHGFRPGQVDFGYMRHVHQSEGLSRPFFRDPIPSAFVHRRLAESNVCSCPPMVTVGFSSSSSADRDGGDGSAPASARSSSPARSARRVGTASSNASSSSSHRGCCACLGPFGIFSRWRQTEKGGRRAGGGQNVEVMELYAPKTDVREELQAGGAARAALSNNADTILMPLISRVVGVTMAVLTSTVHPLLTRDAVMLLLKLAFLARDLDENQKAFTLLGRCVTEIAVELQVVLRSVTVDVDYNTLIISHTVLKKSPFLQGVSGGPLDLMSRGSYGAAYHLTIPGQILALTLLAVEVFGARYETVFMDPFLRSGGDTAVQHVAQRLGTFADRLEDASGSTGYKRTVVGRPGGVSENTAIRNRLEEAQQPSQSVSEPQQVVQQQQATGAVPVEAEPQRSSKDNDVGANNVSEPLPAVVSPSSNARSNSTNSSAAPAAASISIAPRPAPAPQPADSKSSAAVAVPCVAHETKHRVISRLLQQAKRVMQLDAFVTYDPAAPTSVTPARCPSEAPYGDSDSDTDTASTERVEDICAAVQGDGTPWALLSELFELLCVCTNLHTLDRHRPDLVSSLAGMLTQLDTHAELPPSLIPLCQQFVEVAMTQIAKQCRLPTVTLTDPMMHTVPGARVPRTPTTTQQYAAITMMHDRISRPLHLRLMRWSRPTQGDGATSSSHPFTMRSFMDVMEEHAVWYHPEPELTTCYPLATVRCLQRHIARQYLVSMAVMKAVVMAEAAHTMPGTATAPQQGQQQSDEASANQGDGGAEPAAAQSSEAYNANDEANQQSQNQPRPEPPLLHPDDMDQLSRALGVDQSAFELHRSNSPVFHALRGPSVPPPTEEEIAAVNVCVSLADVPLLDPSMTLLEAIYYYSPAAFPLRKVVEYTSTSALKSAQRAMGTWLSQHTFQFCIVTKRLDDIMVPSCGAPTCKLFNPLMTTSIPYMCAPIHRFVGLTTSTEYVSGRRSSQNRDHSSPLTAGSDQSVAGSMVSVEGSRTGKGNVASPTSPTLADGNILLALLEVVNIVTQMLQRAHVNPLSTTAARKLSSAVLHELRGHTFAFVCPFLAPLCQPAALVQRGIGFSAIDVLWRFPAIFPLHFRMAVLSTATKAPRRAVVSASAIYTFGTRTVIGSEWVPASNSNGKVKVKVSRDTLLADAANVFYTHAACPLPIEVEFHGEAGTGSGVTTEFYTAVARALQQRSLNLWVDCSNGGTTYVNHPRGLFPVATRDMPREQRQLYVLLGRLVGRAVLEGRLLDFRLHPLLLQCVFRLHGNMYEFDSDERGGLSRALAAVDPALENTLNNMLALPPNAVADLDIRFGLPTNADVPLNHRHPDTLVTSDNIEEYCTAVRRFYTSTGIQEAMGAIYNGFSEVISPTYVQLFTPAELLVILNGETGSKLWSSAEQFLGAIQCQHGYTHESEQVVRLAQVVAGWDEQQQRAFLQFISGSPCLPIDGLDPQIVVVRRDTEQEGKVSPDQVLPTVNTCFHYVKLPEYSSAVVLEKQLLTAVLEGQGTFMLS